MNTIKAENAALKHPIREFDFLIYPVIYLNSLKPIT